MEIKLKGTALLEFDIDGIKAAGCPVITPVLVANESEVGQSCDRK